MDPKIDPNWQPWKKGRKVKFYDTVAVIRICNKKDILSEVHYYGICMANCQRVSNLMLKAQSGFIGADFILK